MSEEIDSDAFDDLPTTDIEVEAHVHFGMTGSFPLRVAELFFANDGLHIVEYAYVTPLFGLGTRKHKREAKTMQSIYDVHGLDEVLLHGDSVFWLNYDILDRVIVHDGGWLGRPKITIATVDGPTYAYRLHDDLDPESLVAVVDDSAERHGFSVDLVSGVGFAPHENVRRFFGR